MDANQIPWVRVIVVNYNGRRHLQGCIDSLRHQTITDFEAVIVDNGSTDGSIEELELPDNNFTILLAGQNLGFAAANNLGASGAISPWLATLNPDAIAAPNWLEQLRRATEQQPEITAFGSTQISAVDNSKLDGCGDVYSFLGFPWRGGYGHDTKEVPDDGFIFSACAAAALYRREVFEKLGGFDERYFCYLEDVDLGFRLQLTGRPTLQVKGARVAHFGSAITGQGSEFSYFHSARNRLWLIIKNMPLPLLAWMLPFHVMATLWLAWRIRNTDQRRPMLAGAAAALRGVGPIWGRRRTIQPIREISLRRLLLTFNWRISMLRMRSIDVRSTP